MKANYNRSCFHFAAPRSRSSITQLPFHTRRFFFSLSQTRGGSTYPAQHAWSTTLTWICLFFPLRPLLLCSSVTAAPPLNFLFLSLSFFLSSLQLSFSSNWTRHIRWFLSLFFFLSCCFVCNQHIPSSSPVYQDLNLWKKTNKKNPTCMQGGCFQGYRRGTK